MNHNMTIVGMPQSLYYKSKAREVSDTFKFINSTIKGLAAQGIYNATSQILQNRVVLSWREKKSWELAQQIYPDYTNLLVPDIAFQIGPYAPARTPEYAVDVIIFLRKDQESVNKKYRNSTVVQELLNEKGYQNTTFRIVDWGDKNKLFGETKRSVENSIKLLSLGKVVICDRLHASILSYIVGLPFVYLDQVSKKVSSTLEVAFDMWEGCYDQSASRFAEATNFSEGLDKAIEMMKLE